LTADNLTEGWSITREDLDYILDAEIDPSPQETYLKFAHQCKKYGFSEIMVAWLAETAACHPSLLSADSYIEESQDARVFLKESKKAGNTSSAPAFSIFLLMASNAFNQFIKGQPWTAELARIEQKMISH
jgi:hypothetical protein